MLKITANYNKFKIGDTFKYGRTIYTVLSIFEDNGKPFYVCKYTMKDGIISYSNIFTYRIDDDGFSELYKRV